MLATTITARRMRKTVTSVARSPLEARYATALGRYAPARSPWNSIRAKPPVMASVPSRNSLATTCIPGPSSGTKSRTGAFAMTFRSLWTSTRPAASTRNTWNAPALCPNASASSTLRTPATASDGCPLVCGASTIIVKVGASGRTVSIEKRLAGLARLQIADGAAERNRERAARQRGSADTGTVHDASDFVAALEEWNDHAVHRGEELPEQGRLAARG